LDSIDRQPSPQAPPLLLLFSWSFSKLVAAMPRVHLFSYRDLLDWLNEPYKAEPVPIYGLKIPLFLMTWTAQMSIGGKLFCDTKKCTIQHVDISMGGYMIQNYLGYQ